MKRSLHKSRLIKLFTRARWSVSHWPWIFQICGGAATDLHMFLFTHYKTIRDLPQSAVLPFRCINCQDVSVQQSHAGLHSVISNKPRLHIKKIHVRTITSIWTSKKLILITVTENIQNCECVFYCGKRAALWFSNYRNCLACACTSWFPTVLESLLLSCAELRIIFEVQLARNTKHVVSNKHGAWDSWRCGPGDNHQQFRVLKNAASWNLL